MKDVIVIPTYNERENVGTIIPLIFKIAPEVSVLVVDDSSPDGTASIIIELQKQYKNLFLLSQPVKNGLGSAYINGFSHILKEQNTLLFLITMQLFLKQIQYMVLQCKMEFLRLLV